MSTIFPSDFIYLCNKIPEYTSKDNSLDLERAKIRAEKVLSTLEIYLTTLTSDSDGPMRSDTERVIYALRRLSTFYSSPNTSRMSIDDANIFANYIMLTAKQIFNEASGNT